MAETKFIANKADIMEALERVAKELKILYIQSVAGPKAKDVLSVELWKYPELLSSDNVFFIVNATEDIVSVQRVLMNGSTSYSLQVRPGALCVDFQTGGEWHGPGGPKWVMGSIRAFCRNEPEKSFYRRVKTKFLKRFTVGPCDFMPKLAIGPTTSDTIKDIPLATW